jgi:formate hydrogenlyase subunit 3/multisubunit Na+/H+ antiporter MnhD subunit
MTAPLVWIVFPLVFAALLLLLPRERWIAYLGTGFSMALAALAFWLPPDTAQRLGPFSFRIDSTLNLYGRQISLTPADQTVLVLIYGIGAFWFFGTQGAGSPRRIVPLGLAVIALLVASLAAQPFLYAALIIEMAVLLSVPLLVQPGKRPGRGLIRFLIYQTLAMPFILFAGFLLSGIDVGPADVGLVAQAAIFLGLGFAFLLAVFPLYSWVPLLAEEAPPYAVGFILTVFPTFSLIFGLNFMDRYSWLRDTAQFSDALRIVGLLMIATSGVWAAFQRHIGRIFAYTAVAETGISLLAISLPDKQAGLQIIFYLLLPRALAFGVWALSISIFKKKFGSLDFENLRGAARGFPLATAGLVLASLAVTGAPLMASFPVRQALWEKLAQTAFPSALWFGIANLGLWIAALRSLATLVAAPQETSWTSKEDWDQRLLIAVGLSALVIFGLFPQWAQPLLENLPGMFQHLGK